MRKNRYFWDQNQNIMQKFLFLFLSIVIYNFTYSQQINKCYTNEYINSLSVSNPNIKENIAATFQAAKDRALSIVSFKSSNSNAPTTIYRIPVVFHVVYKTNAENVSEALLKSQIDVLNQDFRKLNADTTNYRTIFKDRAADIGFDFFLATIDPDGNPTTGITRTQTNVTSFGSVFPSPDAIDAVKFNSSDGKDAWDTDKYMNIWVCNTGGSLLGFAYPPENAPNWPSNQTPTNKNKWGVVISYQVVGFNNPNAIGGLSIADRGRTCVHESGHYFGLRHIWGDAGGILGGNDCDLTKDDGIDDTPHMGSNSQNDGCDFTKNTCTNGENPDEPDMPENYMDYSDESCQNMFTQGQAGIMQSMIVIGRPLLAHIIQKDTIELTIGDYIVINNEDTFFITSNLNLTLNVGDSVMFLNENNGYNYPVISTTTINGSNSDISINSDGKIGGNLNNSIRSIRQNNSLITLFPNPSSSVVTIQENSFSNIDRIVITNIEGKIQKQDLFEHKALKSFDISNLSNGLYFVSFYTKENLFAIKKISVLK